jgi:hypothetical protein
MVKYEMNFLSGVSKFDKSVIFFSSFEKQILYSPFSGLHLSENKYIITIELSGSIFLLQKFIRIYI